MDNLDKRQRSDAMAKVRARGNASTELRTIKILRQYGITGWRRHYPVYGLPDFAFPKLRVALFIDGCFWHGCPRCYTAPKTSKMFWKLKLAKNKDRDIAVNRHLRLEDWKVMRVWECQLINQNSFLRRIAKITR